MSARDEAIRLAIKLFAALFRRLWLTFGEREERLLAALIDHIIEAAVDARCDDELDNLDDLDTQEDDDDPPPPPPAPRPVYRSVNSDRAPVAAIPQGRRG